MTNFYGPASALDTNTGMPGAAPNGSQMQGNPNLPNGQPALSLSVPQTPVQQLTATQISAGNIPANAVPTNANVQAGTDSLLAQMSRGQIALCDSTYGQSGFIPANGGAGPQSAAVSQAAPQPVTARVASQVSFSGNNYTGN